jgi:AAA domain-containing protein
VHSGFCRRGVGSNGTENARKHDEGHSNADSAKNCSSTRCESLLTVSHSNSAYSSIADYAHVRQWGAVKGLLADQLKAAELTLRSRDWVTAIEGLAGTTKTTIVGAIREFAADQGHTVLGFGMTSGSVKALGEAGVDARTITSLLETPLRFRTFQELWIVNECSLSNTRKTNQIENVMTRPDLLRSGTFQHYT